VVGKYIQVPSGYDGNWEFRLDQLLRNVEKIGVIRGQLGLRLPAKVDSLDFQPLEPETSLALGPIDLTLTGIAESPAFKMDENGPMPYRLSFTLSGTGITASSELRFVGKMPMESCSKRRQSYTTRS
jgi:hypothetical protein